MAERGGDQRRVARALRRAAQRDDGVAGATRFEQDLAPDLLEVGVHRVRLDQRGGFSVRLFGEAALVIGIGARVVRLDAAVAGRELRQRRLGVGDIALQLCLDAQEPLVERGVGAGVVGGRVLDVGLKRRDPLARQRVRLHVRVDLLGRAVIVLLALELLEEGEHPGPADTGLIEELGPRRAVHDAVVAAEG